MEWRGYRLIIHWVRAWRSERTTTTRGVLNGKGARLDRALHISLDPSLWIENFCLETRWSTSNDGSSCSPYIILLAYLSDVRSLKRSSSLAMLSTGYQWSPSEFELSSTFPTLPIHNRDTLHNKVSPRNASYSNQSNTRTSDTQIPNFTRSHKVANKNISDIS